jgi:hypothetical protein
LGGVDAVTGVGSGPLKATGEYLRRALADVRGTTLNRLSVADKALVGRAMTTPRGLDELNNELYRSRLAPWGEKPLVQNFATLLGGDAINTENAASPQIAATLDRYFGEGFRPSPDGTARPVTSLQVQQVLQALDRDSVPNTTQGNHVLDAANWLRSRTAQIAPDADLTAPLMDTSEDQQLLDSVVPQTQVAQSMSHLYGAPRTPAEAYATAQKLNQINSLPESDPGTAQAIYRAVRTAVTNPDAPITGRQVSEMLKMLRSDSQNADPAVRFASQQAHDFLASRMADIDPDLMAAHGQARDTFAALSRMQEGLSAGRAGSLGTSADPGTSAARARVLNAIFESQEGAMGRRLGIRQRMAEAFQPSRTLANSLPAEPARSARQAVENMQASIPDVREVFGANTEASLMRAARAQALGSDRLAGLAAASPGSAEDGSHMENLLLMSHALPSTKLRVLQHMLEQLNTDPQTRAAVLQSVTSARPTIRNRVLAALQQTAAGRPALAEYVPQLAALAANSQLSDAPPAAPSPPIDWHEPDALEDNAPEGTAAAAAAAGGTDGSGLPPGTRFVPEPENLYVRDRSGRLRYSPAGRRPYDPDLGGYTEVEPAVPGRGPLVLSTPEATERNIASPYWQQYRAFRQDAGPEFTALADAVEGHESRGDSRASSGTGPFGLMQVAHRTFNATVASTPSLRGITWNQYRRDPIIQKLVGMHVLADALDRGGNLPDALSIYSSGQPLSRLGSTSPAAQRQTVQYLRDMLDPQGRFRYTVAP